MWQSAYKEIRSVAPNATIVGPDFAYHPAAEPGRMAGLPVERQVQPGPCRTRSPTTTRATATIPWPISSAIESDHLRRRHLARPAAVGERVPARRPADRRRDRVVPGPLRPVRYTNAMRGNWVCCLTPNLTGVLTSVNGSYAAERELVGDARLRRHDRFPGVHLRRSPGPPRSRRPRTARPSGSVAIIGDDNGYTGAASVTYSGLASVPWLASNGSVNVTVDRIPDQYPLSAPQVVYNQNVSVSSGSITVPLTFQAAHDAFAIYLTPPRRRAAAFPTGYHRLVIGNDGLCLDVYGEHHASRRGDRPVDLQRPVQPAVPVRARSPAATARCRRRTPATTSTVTGSATVGRHARHRPASPPTVPPPAPVAAGAAVRRLVGVQEPASGLCLDVYHAVSNRGPAARPVDVQERSWHQPGLHRRQLTAKRTHGYPWFGRARS